MTTEEGVIEALRTGIEQPKVYVPPPHEAAATLGRAEEVVPLVGEGALLEIIPVPWTLANGNLVSGNLGGLLDPAATEKVVVETEFLFSSGGGEGGGGGGGGIVVGAPGEGGGSSGSGERSAHYQHRQLANDAASRNACRRLRRRARQLGADDLGLYRCGQHFGRLHRAVQGRHRTQRQGVRHAARQPGRSRLQHSVRVRRRNASHRNPQPLPVPPQPASAGRTGAALLPRPRRRPGDADANRVGRS